MPVLERWPRWTVITAGLVFALLISLGAYTNTFGPINIDPRPKPPVPGPNRPDPADIWRSLEMPTKFKVSGLELPAPMEMSTSRKFVIIAAQCDGEVKWLISSASGKPIDVLESKLTNSVMILPATGVVEDTIVVVAYTADQNKPSDAAITHIRVRATGPPTPQPPPSPAPPPNVKVTLVHVTFLLDYSKQTKAISEIVNSKELRQWLKDNHHKIHELSIKDDIDSYGLTDYLRGKHAPLLLIQSQDENGLKDGTVIDIQPLISEQQVKDVVLKNTGK